MAVDFKGGFKVGGIEYYHPLTSEEIKVILEILKKSTFTGEDMENLVVVTVKLQEEYKRVKELENK